jgi:hypothetical protein
MPGRTSSFGWTRRVSGVALLAFFLSLIGLTLLAVIFWNSYLMELAGVFTALASVAPLALLLTYYVARPVWALQPEADETAVEDAIRKAIGPRNVEMVRGRKGVFHFCTTVLRVSEPRCIVGWWRPKGAPGSTRSMIFLAGGTKDREALEAFRAAIAEALVPQRAA